MWFQCSDKLGLSLELGSFAAGVMISTTDLAQHTLEQVRLHVFFYYVLINFHALVMPGYVCMHLYCYSVAKNCYVPCMLSTVPWPQQKFFVGLCLIMLDSMHNGDSLQKTSYKSKAILLIPARICSEFTGSRNL